MTVALDLLAGRYHLLDRAGSGGFGTVYRAVDTRLDRTVAVKIVRPDFSHDPDYRARFEREARLASSVCHPNVVYTFDYGEEGHRLYLVMEWLVGPSLLDVLSRRGPLPWTVAAPMVASMLDGLGAIHVVGLAHRDMSPRNVLLPHAEMPKIIDFGVAKRLDDIQFTRPGLAIGSPLYIAPEQIRGDRISAATDLYAVGALLFQLLTGQPVFDGRTADRLLYQQLHELPRDPRTLVPTIPQAVASAILTCLHKDPAERYPSVAALSLALKEGADHACDGSETMGLHEYRVSTERVAIQDQTDQLLPDFEQPSRRRDTVGYHATYWTIYLFGLFACFAVPLIVSDTTQAEIVSFTLLVVWVIDWLLLGNPVVEWLLHRPV
jgi:serine/threonine-protein kinase